MKAPKKQPTPTTVPMPANVALLAMLADGYENNAIPEAFKKAWALMPAAVASIINGTAHSDSGGPSAYSFVNHQLDADVAESRAAEDTYGRQLSARFDRLAVIEPDAWDDIVIRTADPAFYFGLAMGLYLTSNPAALVLNADGTATAGGGR